MLLTGGIAVTFRAEGLTLTMALDAVAELKQGRLRKGSISTTTRHLSPC